MEEKKEATIEKTKESTPKPFPSVGDLFRESWEAFKKSVLYLLAFNVLTFVVMAAIFGIFFVILMLLGIGVFTAVPSIQKGDPAAIASLVGAIAIFIPVFIVLAMIIGSAVQAGTILIVNKYKKDISFGEVIKRSLVLSIPLFLVSILLSILSFGGFFVFIIPAIAFSILFIFAPYEVVLENKRWTGALKSSMSIVMSNFGEVFVRLLLIAVLLIVIYIFENIILLPFTFLGIGMGDNDAALGVMLIRTAISFMFWPINIALSWFLSCYLVALYNHAKEAADPNRKSRLLWVWIIAAVGWVIAIFVGIGIFMLVSTLIKSDSFKKGWNEGFKGETVERKLTTYEAETLAYDIFDEINTYRKGKGLSIIEKDQKLCAYAQRRLDAFSASGKYDNGRGFYEDIGNQSITAAYFSDYGQTGEDTYYPLYNTTTANSIIKFFSRDKDLINGKQYTHGCVMADPNYIILEIGQKTTQSAGNYSGVVPTVKYVFPTYSYPTIAPGQPGSKEWNKEFQRKWDEMGKKIEEAQKK